MADFAEGPAVSAVPCGERDRLNFSIMIQLAKLTHLLWDVMKVQLDNGTQEKMDLLNAEQKSLAASFEALLVQWKAHRDSHGC